MIQVNAASRLTAAKLMAEADYKPMTYQEFKASGKTDAEWDAYRVEQNKLSRERGNKRIIEGWQGEGVSGNDIVNLLYSKGIKVPEVLKKALEHDDTVVSRTSVVGRGLSKALAGKIHKWVSTEMLKMH